MRQAKKDNRWQFRMKTHIGVDETLAAERWSVSRTLSTRRESIASGRSRYLRSTHLPATGILRRRDRCSKYHRRARILVAGVGANRNPRLGRLHQAGRCELLDRRRLRALSYRIRCRWRAADTGAGRRESPCAVLLPLARGDLHPVIRGALVPADGGDVVAGGFLSWGHSEIKGGGDATGSGGG